MPTYQYRCTECGGDLETVQSFSDAALTECPSCSGRLRKVFGSIGLVFKGTGFYKTDSRSGAAGASAGRDQDKDKDKKTSEKASSSAGQSAGDAKESAGSSTSAAAASGSSSKATATAAA